MRIWKYSLAVSDVQSLSMPAGAKLLDVQMQHNFCRLWVLCDENAPSETRHLAIYGTGHSIPADPGEYVATFQVADGSGVFHVFEVQG